MTIFNWEEDKHVAERVSEGMSPLYLPAIPATSAQFPTEKMTRSEYRNKMILDTSTSDSIYHPLDCWKSLVIKIQKQAPRGMGGPRSLKIRLSLDSKAVEVQANVDCKAPYRAGMVGTGPYSPLMEAVKKIELTIKRKKYRTLRSGEEVNDSGYSFSDHTGYNSGKRWTMKYRNAWSVGGEMKISGTSRSVKIILGSVSIPKLEADPTVNEILIGGLTFVLRRDQFFFMEDDTIVVNPIVLGYHYDISILFDSSQAGKPRVGFKILDSRIPYRI